VAATDQEWESTLSILNALPQVPVERYVGHEKRVIDWPDLLNARHWSTGEQVLLRAAQDLWNGAGGCTLGEIVSRLDDENYELVLEALELRRPRS
jgi:hypothetical protein